MKRRVTGLGPLDRLTEARAVLTAISLLIALSSLAAVWLPLFLHYRIDSPTVTAAEVAQVRGLDNDHVLQELKDYSFNPGSRDNAGDVVARATQALNGAWQISPSLELEAAATFAQANMDFGPDRWQLSYAGLAVPSVLLEAYEATGEERYFDAARAFILDFAAFEQQAILPKGFLWNDHAIAARIVVLARFWRLYKARADFDTESAALLLTQVARSVAFLADEDHYTYATNHGFMQNLGILHACLAFGIALCGEDRKNLALERLEQQLKYYVNREGVILEHSAGYQRFGLVLFGYLLRYMDLLGAKTPDLWRRKYENAKAVYAALRRPDGSLPLIGDTTQGSDTAGPEILSSGPGGELIGPMGFRSNWRPEQARAFFPAAGHLIWWNGLETWPRLTGLNQMVITWSYYPGHGHKHADETSLLFWADGERWWTAPGYILYPPNQANLGPWGHTSSWEAANAPHLVGERPEADRFARLLGYGWSDSAAIADLERSDGRGFLARRQVIHLAPGIWIVLDHFTDRQNRRVRTIWQSDTDKFHALGRGTPLNILTSESSGRQLPLEIFGAPEPEVRSVKGATDPYAGWVLSKSGELAPSPAFIVEQASNDAWTAMVWSFQADNGHDLVDRPVMKSWDGPDSWTLIVPRDNGPLRLTRDGDQLSILTSPSNGATGPTAPALTIQPPPDVQSAVQEARTAFAAAADTYGARFRNLVPFRAKASYALLAAFLLQELTLLLLGRFRRGYATALRLTTVPPWIVIIFWLLPTYFAQ